MRKNDKRHLTATIKTVFESGANVKHLTDAIENLIDTKYVHIDVAFDMSDSKKYTCKGDYEDLADRIENAITEILKISSSPVLDTIERYCAKHKVNIDTVCRIGRFLHYHNK